MTSKLTFFTARSAHANAHHAPSPWKFALLAAWLFVGRAAAAEPTVPELFAGELDDVGPQYLLVAQATAQPWTLWTDAEITATSNATLVASNPTSSTITVAQTGLNRTFGERGWLGGQLRWEAGLKAQAYRYGFITGVKQMINFLEVDRNNFDLIGAHLRADWKRDALYASATLRASTMRSKATNQTFYDEAALETQFFRNWALNPHRTFALGAEAAMRLSRTDSYGLLPAGWNDRAELGLVAILDQMLSAKLHLQPALRLLGSRYTHAGRDRSDIHGSGRIAVTWTLNPRFEVRLSGGYDRRESSEALISDYAKWDLGLGVGGHWRF